MNKSRIYGLVLLSALLVGAAVSTPAQGAVYGVGVKPGDWAEYSESVSLVSGSVKVRVDVTTVSGTTVNLTETFYDAQGHVAYSLKLSGDLASYSGFLTLMFFLIPANLTQGDPISPGSPIVINQTIPVAVAGTERNCNLLSMGASFQGNTVSEDIYWDQLTGILVEMSAEMSSISGSYSETLMMTSTSLWSVDYGALGTVVLVGAAFAVGLLAVVIPVVVIRSRRKNA
ncbi:MAG: hypothetical protein WED04_09010 [Promethearchaeati archaeon SRVP18_Atabeyarchaeia-1]